MMWPPCIFLRGTKIKSENARIHISMGMGIRNILEKNNDELSRCFAVIFEETDIQTNAE